MNAMNFKHNLSNLSLYIAAFLGFLSIGNAVGVAEVKNFDSLMNHRENILFSQNHRVISQGSIEQTSTLETKIISQINQARKNPSDYANWLETQKQYYDGIMLKLPNEKPVRTNRGLQALEEAVDFMRQQAPLNPLNNSEATKIMAQEQLTAISKRSASRAATDSNGNRRNSGGQNITYGKVTAEAIVMQLVVDDGFRDRRHRLAMFSPDNQEIGVSCREDPVYEQICAIAYVGNIEETTVPEELIVEENSLTVDVGPELSNPVPLESELSIVPELTEPINIENIDSSDQLPLEERLIEENEATKTPAALNTQPNQEHLIDRIERGFLEEGDKVIPNDGSLYDSYPLSVKAGESFVISLESTDFDTFLAIMDEEGNIIEQNDDLSDNDSNSQLKVTIPNEGTYNLIVNSYEKGGKGAYILTIRR